MPQFNLEEYEPVADRLDRFWTDHPEGRVWTEILPAPEGQWLVRAAIYFVEGDKSPAAVGHAHETVGQGMVNRTSALENCETSAIGRALANCGYAPKGFAKRPSREEMAKVVEAKVEKVAKVAVEAMTARQHAVNEAKLRVLALADGDKSRAHVLWDDALRVLGVLEAAISPEMADRAAQLIADTMGDEPPVKVTRGKKAQLREALEL